MSFTIITSSISDYWESFAPAANLNSNRRFSSDFCSLKRIILCIHCSHRGQLTLYLTKKSKPLSYVFLYKLTVYVTSYVNRISLFQGTD